MSGVLFPLDSSGKRSTTGVNKHIFSTAIAEADAECADKIMAERKWRSNYAEHIYSFTVASVRTPETTLDVARRGLNAISTTFDFCRDGQTMKIGEAMSSAAFDQVPLTGVVEGEGGEVDVEKALRLLFEGEELRGERLIQMLEQKQEAAELEGDVIEAVRDLVADSADKLKLLDDTVFVIFGATSELCPLEPLLELGLHVAGIARPSAKKQAKLIDIAKRSPRGATLALPVLDTSVGSEILQDMDKLGEVTGADMLVFTPEVKNWLLQLYPNKRLVIGSYIYLDGANHVRASVAMDAIIEAVIKERPDTALMYLGSPATVYPIPADAHADAMRRRSKGAWWHNLTPLKYTKITPTTLEEVNENASNKSKEMIVFSGIVNVQGPNYCLAKTLQHWRAMIARDECRCTVSINMAPTCATDSVMHVSSVARAVRGMRAFPPLTYFEPVTARKLMTMLMLYDLTFSESEANPEVPLRNPMDLFSSLGVHGGLWRCPYTVESTGTLSYLADLLNLV